jgi:hypothetical protein
MLGHAWEACRGFMRLTGIKHHKHMLWMQTLLCTRYHELIHDDPAKEPTKPKVCAYCGKPLVGRAIKYCNQECNNKYAVVKRNGG